MYTQERYIGICRYMFLIGGTLGTLSKIPVYSYAPFILLSLIVIINSQVRIAYLKGKPVILSIIIEAVLLFYLSYHFGGFTYFIAFSGMTDACMLLEGESYTLSAFLGIGLAYLTYRMYPVEWTAVILAFYIILFLFLLQLKKEMVIRTDTEALYDRIRKYTYELEAARSRLLDYSRQVESVAQLEERNRISRELHDSIGHSLTGILMQVDACIQIIQVDRDKGLEILKSVYQNINTSIEVVRQTVRKLRPAEYRTNLEALNGLIEKFKADTGVNVEFKLDGTPFDILPSIETVIYRNTQEAMTNAVRHGHAKNIAVHLLYKRNAVELTISNDGQSAGTIRKGFGLSGIEERMGLIGGTVSFRGENGFIVHMSIPVNVQQAG
jgi:signal transduction histidine kinase